MTMRYVYAVIMLVSSVIAFFYATRVFYNRNYKKVTYRLFSVLAIASGVWSLGYGMMFLQDNMSTFVVFRGVGIVGIVLFMISGQVVLSVLGNIILKIWPLITLEGLVGVGVLIVVGNPKSITMTLTSKGIITEFVNSGVSLAYTLYCVVIAGVFVLISIAMTNKKNSKRIQAFGRAFIKVEILIGLGMIVDTVLPAIGINPNIPASTMFQFIGLEIIYYAVHKMNRNLISMENMTGYNYQSLKSPVLVFDESHEVRLSNKQADSMFELDDVRVHEKDFWKKCFGLEKPSDVENAKNTVVVEAVHKHDGTNCRLYIDPIFDEYKDYIGYIVVVTDMTEQIKNMEAIRQAKNEAELANRAKSMFLANMSHEIRTPMNSILGFSELALKTDVDGRAKEYFTDIKQSAEILLSTINDILDISKIESGKMELVEAPFKTADIFREVSTIIQMQASKKNLSFFMKVDEHFPSELYGDKARIREILINLLNNGIKYTKEGHVNLAARLVEVKDNVARVAFRVSDTGMGMRKEDLNNIFESFKRVDIEANRQTEGTGLGLSITKGFVELMGGNISVESEYGMGSTFSVELCLPIEDATPVDLDATKKEIKKHANTELLKGINILAVDDNPINLKVISNALEIYGGSCDTAVDGMSAIEMCSRKRYKLVFMDHMMPEMDGIEAMKRIRALKNGYETGGDNKILVLTANTLNGVREEMLELGFDEFLSKPIEFEIMETVLESIIGENRETVVEQAREMVSEQAEKAVAEQSEEKTTEQASVPANGSLASYLPSIDVKAGMKNCLDNEDLYIKILGIAVASADKELAKVKTTYEEKNYKDFIIAIHGIKGECNNLGALSLGERAKELEFAGKAGEYEIIDEKLSGVMKDFTALMEEIKLGLNSYQNK